MSKIIRLEAENIKKLKAVEVTPEGHIVLVGGKNGAGKTSLLDSIEYALCGGKSIPQEPIRKGEEKARIVCELEDLIVTRGFTRKGSSLIVAARNGARYMSPQSILDKLVGKISFDPLVFARMEKKAQVETLRELVGLDFAGLDAERQRVYDERTDIGKKKKELQVYIEKSPHFPDAPAEEISFAELVLELGKIEEHNKGNQKKRQECMELKHSLEGLDKDIKHLSEKIGEVEKQLRKLQDQRDTKLAEFASGKIVYDETKDAVNALQDMDGSEIRQKLATSQQINKQVQANIRRQKLEAELEQVESQYRDHTILIESIDAQKGEILREAKFPVDGLSFDESGVYYQGIPFNQASAAEQLRVSVAMGLAMNPTLKVLLIRDGSLLDEDNLKMLSDMAKEADAQIWLEKVSEGDDIQVIIEDGSIRKKKADGTGAGAHCSGEGNEI